MLSYAEALSLVLQTVQPLPSQEMPLREALGRVLAEPVAANLDLPPADNSAMDGFAFAYGSWLSGTPLRVAGFVGAGQHRLEPVGAGETVRIMTGAPLPPGCDTVVPLEEVREEAGTIQLQALLRQGDHVRRRGEELRQGEPVLPVGTPIRSGETGLLAAAGIDRVRIHPAPRVAVLSTGDELVELGTLPGPGQIVNSNAHMLAARLREEGCEPQLLGIARDNPEELAAGLRRGLDADLLLTTGGVSVGDRDYVQEVLAGLGFTKKFWKVAIKPGKPVLFGTIGERPVFGLPGNPAAAAATFELFVRPALRRLAGFRDASLPRLRVTLAERVKGSGNRQQFLWGRVEIRDGCCHFCPGSRQGSGQHRSLQGSQALLPVPPGGIDLAAGDEVEILLLRLPSGREAGEQQG